MSFNFFSIKTRWTGYFWKDLHSVITAPWLEEVSWTNYTVKRLKWVDTRLLLIVLDLVGRKPWRTFTSLQKDPLKKREQACYRSVSSEHHSFVPVLQISFTSIMLSWTGGLCQQIYWWWSAEVRTGSGGDPLPHESRAHRGQTLHRETGW